jgi:hypothetical protein
MQEMEHLNNIKAEDVGSRTAYLAVPQTRGFFEI